MGTFAYCSTDAVIRKRAALVHVVGQVVGFQPQIEQRQRHARPADGIYPFVCNLYCRSVIC